jgi:hypothetical protein
MESTLPRVSVLTIANEDRALFHQAVQNVETQSLKDFELVVVDRSPDAWHVPLEWDDPRLRLVQAPNVTEDAAWNLGFEKCRGDYVAMLAPKHASRPVRLARQAAWLDHNPSVVLIGTASGLRQQIWEAPPEPAKTDRDIIHWSLLAGVEMAWSSLMLRRQAAGAQGVLLRESFGEAARLDLCLRLCAKGDVARIDEVLTLCPADRAKPSGKRLDDVRRALQAAYEPILGAGYGPIMREGAARAAELVALHLVGDQPVPDAATRDELETVLATLAHSLNPAAGADIMARAIQAAEGNVLFKPGENVTYRPNTVVAVGADTVAGDVKAPPRVSVVTVAADAALLEPTLDSLRTQSLQDFELVIVDRSAPGAAPIRPAWSDERLRIVPGSGLTEDAAWNLGFAESSAAYVAMLATGNISRPARLARQAAWLDRNPAVVLVGTASGVQPAAGAPELDPTRTDRGVIHWLLHAGVEMAWSSMMLRRDAVQSLGVLLREECGLAARFDLCHRLCAIGDVTRLDEVLTVCLTKPATPSAARMQAIRRVLERAYAPIMAEGAPRAADLVARHVAGYEAIPKPAVLDEIEAVLVSLGQWMKATGKVDGVSRAMIAVERGALRDRMARQSGWPAGGAATPLGVLGGAGKQGGRLSAALGSLLRAPREAAVPGVSASRWNR